MAEGNDDGSHDDEPPRDRAAHLVPHRWRPGQSGNPGGSSTRQRDLNAAVRDMVKPGHVRDVIATLYNLAVAGDVSAAKIFLDRVVGPVTPDDVDLTDAPEEVLEWLAALGKRRN